MKEMKVLSLVDVVNMFLSLIKTPTFLDEFLHTSNMRTKIQMLVNGHSQ